VVAIGRVIIGDVAATLVDLAVRGYLRVEQDPADGNSSWVITADPGGAQRSGSLLEYEQTLLAGLSRACKLSAAAAQLPDTLDKMRTAVIRDAVHRGWLKRMHHDERTEEGEQVATRARAFQRQLRSLKSSAGVSAFAGRLLPYALHFGLADPDQDPLVRFAHSFAAVLADLPGWRPPEHTRPPMVLSEVLEKPSIDQQMMDPLVGAGVWLTGW
jgi:hypothetical protein